MKVNVLFQNNADMLSSIFGSFSKDSNNIKIILEMLPSAVVLVDAEGRFLYVNKRGCELYGFDYSGFNIDRQVATVKALRLDGSPLPLEEMPVNQSLLSGQTVRNVEMIIQSVNGVRYPVSVSSAPLFDADNKICGAIVIFEQFGESKMKDKELIDVNEELAQKAEDKYRMLFNSIDQGFFLIDIIFDENGKPVDMLYVEANAAATKMLGKDFTGWRLRELDPNYEEYWFDIFGKVALTGQSVRMEQYAEPDKKWYSFYIFRIDDEKSNRVGNIFLDITERKRMEDALRDSERLYRTFFESTEDGFVLVQPIFNESGHSDNYLMVQVNQVWEKQTGLKAVDFIGKTIKECMPDVESVWPFKFADVVKSGKSVHFESYNSDSNRWYDLYAFNYKQDMVGVIFRDITERKRAEEVLTFQAHMLASLQEAICAVDENFNITFWNGMAEKIFGWTAQEAIGSPSKEIFKMVSPSSREETIANIQKNDGYIGEAVYRNKDGKEVHASVICSIIWDAQRKYKGNVSSFRDITEQKRVEKALRESETKFRQMAETVGSAFWISEFDSAGSLKYIYMSPAFERIFGIPVESIYDNPRAWMKMIHPDDSERFFLEQKRRASGEYVDVLDIRFIKNDGTIRWIKTDLFPLKDRNGKIVRYVGIADDITERKQVEEKLRESEERFRAVHENSLDRFAILKPFYNDQGEIVDFTYEYLNAQAAKTTGQTPERLVGIRLSEGWPTFPQTHFFKMYKQAIETGQALEFEDCYRTDGLDDWFYAKVTPIPGGIAAATQIITERKRAEKALHKSEEKFRVAQELSPDGFTIFRPVRDANGQIIDFTWVYENTAIAMLGGTDPDAVVGRRLLELFPGHLGTPFLEAYLHVAETGESRIFEAEYGLETMLKPTWFRIVVVRMNGDIAVLAQDITERKRLEQKLEGALHVAETNRLILEAVIQQMPVGIILTNATGTQARNNAAMDTIWRRKMEASENINSHAYVAYHPNGTEYKPEEWPLTRALINDEVVIGEEMSFLRGDGTIGTLLCSSAAIKDESGATIAGIAIDSDITDLRQAQDVLLLVGEKTLLNEKVKNETLQKTIDMKDEFLLTITHEFKTPLSVINSALQTIEMTCAKDLTARIHKYHNVIKLNSNRQLRLVNNLLDVTRMGAGHLRTEKKNVDIVALTKAIVASIAVYAEQKGLALSLASTMKSKIIGLDEEKYERILLNLLSNAVKFTPAGQSIAVDVSRKAALGMKRVCIRVKDTGVGIPEDKKELVFEKFGQVGSTRTRQAEGSGIGLHLVKMLVELLGGEISLESQVGEGSTFTVLLPDEKTKEPEVHAGLMTQEKNDGRLIEATALEFSDFQV